jgi:hypothetical protein
LLFLALFFSWATKPLLFVFHAALTLIALEVKFVMLSQCAVQENSVKLSLAGMMLIV